MTYCLMYCAIRKRFTQDKSEMNATYDYTFTLCVIIVLLGAAFIITRCVCVQRAKRRRRNRQGHITGRRMLTGQYSWPGGLSSLWSHSSERVNTGAHVQDGTPPHVVISALPRPPSYTEIELKPPPYSISGVIVKEGDSYENIKRKQNSTPRGPPPPYELESSTFCYS